MALLAACWMWPGWARAVTAPGPDAFGYTVAPTTNFSFVEITNSSTRVLWFDDDAAVTNVSLGFNFRFYGTSYSNVSFNLNGLMTFGGASTNFANVNLLTTSPAENLPTIAVLWDDWETQSPGSDGVYFKTTGPVGSRQFIVQWNKVIPVNGTGTNPVTFQARLFEDSNRILFSYRQVLVVESNVVASLGAGATVGIRDVNGQITNRNLLWSHNQTLVTNGMNLLFSPSNQATGLTAPLITGIKWQATGGFGFSFTNRSGASFTVLASTNPTFPLAQWLNLGPAVETPPGSGQYQFADLQTTNHGQRFYRVRSP